MRQQFKGEKMPSLYALAEEAIEIQQILEDSAGELTPELEQRLDELMSGSEQKLESAAYVVRMLENQAEECRQEVERLLARARSFDNQGEALRQRMRVVVDSVYGGKFKSARWTLWVQKSPDVVRFEVPENVNWESLQQELPEAIRVKYDLNRTELKRMYESAELLPDAIKVLSCPGIRGLRMK